MRDAQDEAAIATHSEQAGEFAEAYAGMAADPYASCFAYSRKRLDEWLERLLPPPAAGRRLLDVGCGTGHHLARLRAAGYDAAGVDGSATMLAEARKLNPAADLRLATVDRLPFPSASFDAVLSIEVLRYLRDQRPMLAEVARVLRPGGVAVLTAAPRFNLNGYWIVNRVAAALPIPGFVRLKQFFNTGGGLRESLRRAGFHEVEVHGVYWGPINWVERLMPPALPGVLRRWEHADRALSDRPLLRELANMFAVRAVRE